MRWRLKLCQSKCSPDLLGNASLEPLERNCAVVQSGIRTMTCYDMLQHDRQCVAAITIVLQTHNLACPCSAVPQSEMHDMTRMRAIIPMAFWLLHRATLVRVAFFAISAGPTAAWVACRIALYLRVTCVASLCTCVSRAL